MSNSEPAPFRISDQRRTRRRIAAQPAHARSMGRAWHGTAPDACRPQGALSPSERAEMARRARAVGRRTCAMTAAVLKRETLQTFHLLETAPTATTWPPSCGGPS